MTIREFLAHTSPGKSRVFAIDGDRPQFLEAVTSLSADDLHRTGDLLDTLNTYLVSRDDAVLADALSELPGAVRIAVLDFMKEHCPPPPLGYFGDFGPIDQLRLDYFEDEDVLKEYVEAAYLIGLGVRVSNQAGVRGRVSWQVELLSDEVFVPAGGDPRTWALPPAPLLSTWTSRLAKGDPVASAFEVALTASADGHRVRLHTFTYGKADNIYDAGSTSEVRVDVFAAPVSAREE